jgi:hypothetical protein
MFLDEVGNILDRQHLIEYPFRLHHDYRAVRAETVAAGRNDLDLVLQAVFFQLVFESVPYIE